MILANLKNLKRSTSSAQTKNPIAGIFIKMTIVQVFRLLNLYRLHAQPVPIKPAKDETLAKRLDQPLLPNPPR